MQGPWNSGKGARGKDGGEPLLAGVGAEGMETFDAPVRTVKQVNALIQSALAANLPGYFLVQGEISNFRVYERGHAFFTLKEPGAELPCVCWKDALARLKFKPGDGMAVVARGAVKMYEPQGKIQLYVEDLYPQGMGKLELAFRQLCAKLKAEGLFEAERKRALPRLPQRVAILTSRTGDVLHDVLTTAYRRYPGLHLMLLPVPVQGAGAAGKIAEGIKMVNAYSAAREERGEGAIDLMLLVRGGGSLEDLWAFNEEAVARAIVASRVPIATGIGHEPDTTIADFVGDLRGPTPTGVTELTIPDVRVLGREVARLAEAARAEVRGLELELTQALRQRVRRDGARVEEVARQIAAIEPRHAIAQGWRRVDEAGRRLAEHGRGALRRTEDGLTRLQWRLAQTAPLARIQREADRVGHLEAQAGRALRNRLAAAGQKLAAAAGQLKTVSPQSVLERGYSITRDAEGRLVRSKLHVATGDVVTTRVSDGEFRSTVGTPRQGHLF